jgi:hypothetical protein
MARGSKSPKESHRHPRKGAAVRCFGSFQATARPPTRAAAFITQNRERTDKTMTHTISERYEKQVNGKWETTYYTEDEKRVNETLARCLLAKYVYKASWVRRIVVTSNYDDTMTAKVYEDNGGRRTIIYRR